MSKLLCTKGLTVACIKAVSGGCNPGECKTGAEGMLVSIAAGGTSHVTHEYPRAFEAASKVDPLILAKALDHIARTAARSRTSTRRLRWIERRALTALRGDEYRDIDFGLPGFWEARVQTTDFEDQFGGWSQPAGITGFSTQIRTAGAWVDAPDSDYVRNGTLWVPARKVLVTP